MAEEMRVAVGSPPWIAPEQVVGVRGDPRSDVFAIGVMLYEMATGELPFGDPLRSALETSVLGGMARLSFDTAGRITLPDTLCEMFGLTDWVAVVGLGERFQIWSREAFQAHRAAQRELARDGLAAMRAQQRTARIGGVA